MTDNPYQSPEEQTASVSAQTRIMRICLAAIAFLSGLGIAASAVNRVYFYGGAKVLIGAFAASPTPVALWALSHLLGILSAFVVCAGVVRKSNRMVLSGIVVFLGLCVFAWAWPMDFLWFG